MENFIKKNDIYKSNKIFGIAYNYGQLPEKDRVQVWFDKPISSVIFDKQPLILPSHFN